MDIGFHLSFQFQVNPTDLAAMNLSATVVQISIPFLAKCIVSLPLFGMVASFITSILFTKEQIFESECGVSAEEQERERERRRHASMFSVQSRNFTPSFSSVIGVSPGKNIWRMPIAFHCFPRFLITSLYHNQFKTSLNQLKYHEGVKRFLLKLLIRVNTFFELCEVFGLISLSYISRRRRTTHCTRKPSFSSFSRRRCA